MKRTLAIFSSLSSGLSLFAVSRAPRRKSFRAKWRPSRQPSSPSTIDAHVSLKLADGTYETIVAPASVERFNAIKVGDTLTATYYDNIVLRVKKPGEKDVDTAEAALTKTPGTSPGATAAKQRTITATITAIDMKVPSITLVGPNNWKYSSRVQDINALKTVKVGDKLDITWTEALLVGFTPAKK